jgi:glycerophosphoryl diester phosphodiesterase
MFDLNNLSHPIIMAHRGASAVAPENTLAAFTTAVKLGADAIEMDVKLTSDKEVVVIHDRSVNRTTNGTGEVKFLTFKEINMLDAGIKFSSKYSGEKIPGLREICETLKGKLLLNIELTNYGTFLDALPLKVADLISEYDMQREVLVSSFNILNLIRFHQYLPFVQLAVLVGPDSRSRIFSTIFAGRFGIKFIHPHFSKLTPEIMGVYRKRFSRIHPWTVNKAEDMRSLFSLKVDGIITDYPDIARSLIFLDEKSASNEPS